MICYNRISRTYFLSFTIMPVLVSFNTTSSHVLFCSFFLPDLQTVDVETCSAWRTTPTVSVGGTPPSARVITAQMEFLPSRNTLSQRTRAPQKLWTSPTCDPSPSTALTSMPATRRWGAAALLRSSSPGPNRQVRSSVTWTTSLDAKALSFFIILCMCVFFRQSR